MERHVWRSIVGPNAQAQHYVDTIARECGLTYLPLWELEAWTLDTTLVPEPELVLDSSEPTGFNMLFYEYAP